MCALIKGFSTKDPEKMLKQMKDAGVTFKFGFSSDTEIKVEKNPFGSFDKEKLKASDGKTKVKFKKQA